MCNFWSVVCLSFGVFLSTTCLSQPLQETSDSFNRYPWIATLWFGTEFTDDLIVSCLGSLISNNYILTAGNCVSEELSPSRKLTKVRLGACTSTTACDATKGCREFGIEKVIIHPGLEKRKNDIALVKLNQSIEFSETIQAIGLGAAVITDQIGYVLDVAEKEPEDINAMRVKTVDFTTCKKEYKRFRAVLDDNQFCAAGIDGKGPCYGSAGGPLMIKAKDESGWYTNGIVSFGPSKCGTKPDVYTRVGKYLDWIRETMKNE